MRRESRCSRSDAANSLCFRWKYPESDGRFGCPYHSRCRLASPWHRLCRLSADRLHAFSDQLADFYAESRFGGKVSG